MVIYRIFYHTPFKKGFIDIPARDINQAIKRVNSLYKNVYIDSIFLDGIKVYSK